MAPANRRNRWVQPGVTCATAVGPSAATNGAGAASTCGRLEHAVGERAQGVSGPAAPLVHQRPLVFQRGVEGRVVVRDNRQGFLPEPIRDRGDAVVTTRVVTVQDQCQPLALVREQAQGSPRVPDPQDVAGADEQHAVGGREHRPHQVSFATEQSRETEVDDHQGETLADGL